jgi:hypothetical protein
MASKVMKWILGLALIAALAVGATQIDPLYVKEKVVLNAGVATARRALDTDRCEQAYKAEFPELAGIEDLPLVEVFENLRIVVVPNLHHPLVAGTVNCDISTHTIVVSLKWALWSDIDEYAATLIHEFTHTLQCKDVFQKYGSYGQLTSEQNNEDPAISAPAINYEVELEASAYRIAGACTGTPVPSPFRKESK